MCCRGIFGTKWHRYHYCWNLWWVQPLHGINALDYVGYPPKLTLSWNLNNCHLSLIFLLPNRFEITHRVLKYQYRVLCCEISKQLGNYEVSYIRCIRWHFKACLNYLFSGEAGLLRRAKQSNLHRCGVRVTIPSTGLCCCWLWQFHLNSPFNI